MFAGTLKDWKLVFYGTETSPEGEEHEEDEEDDIHQDIVGSNKVGPPPIGVVEQDPGHNEVESVIGSGRVDSADLTRNEVQRTTTEDDAPPSSGCIALSKKGQHCIGLCLLVILIASFVNFTPSPTFSTSTCDGHVPLVKCSNLGGDGSPHSQRWRTDCDDAIRTERTVDPYSESESRSH